MVVGLLICVWGFYEMWQISDTTRGFATAKPFYIVGGVIFLAGALVNHWEHLRRKGD
jgi:hypothetical protein